MFKYKSEMGMKSDTLSQMSTLTPEAIVIFLNSITIHNGIKKI